MTELCTAETINQFRTAEPKDARVLAEMEQRYIECPWSETVLLQTIADELSLIKLLETAEGSLIGYGGIKMALDTADIYNIVVHDSFRRCGYGRLIVAKIMDCAVKKGAREIFLEVAENNAAAIALYTGCGFEIVAVRKKYYKSGNALVMKRNL